MHSLQRSCCLNVGQLMINILYYKICSTTDQIASFTVFFPGLMATQSPRSPGYEVGFSLENILEQVP